MKRSFLLSFVLFSVSIVCYTQNSFIPLWPKEIPNSKLSDETEKQTHRRIIWLENVQIPGVEVFLPSNGISGGKAVVICPGGGYHGLSYDWEGTDFAKLLNSKGIAAFVLKYRLPISKSVTVSHDVPLQDVQRAIRLVRNKAEYWGIDKNKIGIMGFSAGGHLASTLGTHYYKEFDLRKDSVDLESARPDFMALIYPVISMKKSITHDGSRKALLGNKPDQELVDLFSNELQVDKQTPPCFLLHATDDSAVPVENSLLFYQALKKFEVPTELHIYSKGGHGFGLAFGKGSLEEWPDLLLEWLYQL